MRMTNRGDFITTRAAGVAAKDVPQPVRLRCLFREPWHGALQNEVGLPLGPFRIAGANP